MHIGDGHTVYIYNNISSGNGKDITFSRKTGNFELEYGEETYNLGGKFYSHISPVTEKDSIIKFLDDGDKEDVIPERISYTNDLIHLKAVYNEDLIKEAWSNANTFILGNTARNGGGFGSNANLETPDNGDYNLKIKKKWDSEFKEIPEESIIVDIFIVPENRDEKYVRLNYATDPNLFKYGEITLSEENNWQASFNENKFLTEDDLSEKLEKVIGSKTVDNGLPFTSEELSLKGYKYLVMERGDKYFTEITEIKPEKSKEIESTSIKLNLILNDEIKHFYPDYIEKENKDIYVYEKDSNTNKLVLLDKGELIDNNGEWEVILSNPLFNNINKIEYYGKDKVFSKWEEDWMKFKGYHPGDNGFAIEVKKNEDGSVNLLIPYMWTQSYDDTENGEVTGFKITEVGKKTITTKPIEVHEFIINNYKYGELIVCKDWETKLDEKEIPESLRVYLLLNGERIIESYDEKGNPIYKSIELKKSEDWKGTFKNLNPKFLARGNYSIEEEILDYFAPKIKFIESKDKIEFRIGLKNSYDTEDGNSYTTADIFDHLLGDINLHLYINGKEYDKGQFKWSTIYDEFEGTPLVRHNLKNEVFFGKDKEIILPLNGKNLRIESYDLVSNSIGLTDYNFYIQQDNNGAMTLFVPRLMIDGIPYDLFEVTETETNDNFSYDEIRSVVPEVISDSKYQITNFDGPNHEIELLKKWIGKTDKAPEEITLVVTDKDNVERKIILSKSSDWKNAIENLRGTFRLNEYKIKEIQIDGYKSSITKEFAGLKIETSDNGRDLSFVLNNRDVLEAIKSGNYKYEIFELDEKDKDKVLSRENINDFVRVIKNKDGSYTIRYAEGLKLTEVLRVTATNTYYPPEVPPETPPDSPPDTPPETPPDTPPGTPPETPPDTPPGTPPEIPETPPETPPEEPEVSKIPEVPETPKIPEEPEALEKSKKSENPNEIPKTGINDNLNIVIISGGALIALLALKKKYYKN